MSTPGRGGDTATGYTPEQLSRFRQVADLLDDDATFELIAGAIADSRDKAPRDAHDRDSGDVLDDVIAALRNTH